MREALFLVIPSFGIFTLPLFFCLAWPPVVLIFRGTLFPALLTRNYAASVVLPFVITSPSDRTHTLVPMQLENKGSVYKHGLWFHW